MRKEDIIEKLLNYGEDLKSLKTMKKDELNELLNDYENHSDMFPNDDEYDGSHELD